MPCALQGAPGCAACQPQQWARRNGRARHAASVPATIRCPRISPGRRVNAARSHPLRRCATLFLWACLYSARLIARLPCSSRDAQVCVREPQCCFFLVILRCVQEGGTIMKHLVTCVQAGHPTAASAGLPAVVRASPGRAAPPVGPACSAGPMAGAPHSMAVWSPHPAAQDKATTSPMPMSAPARAGARGRQVRLGGGGLTRGPAR